MALAAVAALVLAGCAAPSSDGSAVADGASGTTASSSSAPSDPAMTSEPADDGAMDDGAMDDGGDAAADSPLAFTATTVAGGEVDVASFAGEPVVLWFWAPWCTICRSEAPDVTTVADDLAGDVTFLGVAGLGETDAMRGFVDDTGVGGFEHLADVDGSIWGRFGVVSQPTFAFVSADGEVEIVSGSLGEDALRDRATALVDG